MTYRGRRQCPQLCAHTGAIPVRVGEYEVRAAGVMYPNWCNSPRTVFVPLLEEGHSLNSSYYGNREVVALPLVDFGGVPDNWRALLEEWIVPRLKAGDDLFAFCVGSHGRTGTFLASLIALLEPPEVTPDPIAAVRGRHCVKAVETQEQAEAIFALRGQAVPRPYVTAFVW